MQKFFSSRLRNPDGKELLENFFISAIFSILSIRIWLEYSGYIQIEFGRPTLHIAHVLWGGLLMLIAIIILLSYVDRDAKNIASIIGGIGFGSFIDEIGKFITADNNYFYEPAVAIIYAVFVALFLLLRAFDKIHTTSRKEIISNIFEELREMYRKNMSFEEKERALEYIGKLEPRDALFSALLSQLKHINTQTSSKDSIINRVKNACKTKFHIIVTHQYISRLVVVIFIIISIFNLISAVTKIDEVHSFSQRGQLISVIASGICVVIGLIFYNKRDKIRGLEWFKNAVLISIFLTQFFLFYIDQVSAIIYLFANILLYIVIRYLISKEAGIARKRQKQQIFFKLLSLIFCRIKNIKSLFRF